MCVYSKPTRTRTMFTEEGQKVRVARKTKTIIPKPPWERKDFKSRSGYIGKDRYVGTVQPLFEITITSRLQ